MIKKIAWGIGLYLVLGYSWLYYKTWIRRNPGLVIDPSHTIGIRDTRMRREYK